MYFYKEQKYENADIMENFARIKDRLIEESKEMEKNGTMLQWKEKSVQENDYLRRSEDKNAVFKG